MINNDLNLLSIWCLNNGLIINEKKTEVINFSWKIPNTTFNNLFCLNGVFLTLTDEVKCLGFIIDRKLSWESHINSIIKKVNFGLRNLNHCSFSFPLNLRKKLVHALLISQILYGLEVYSGTTSCILDKLRICLNNIVRFTFKIAWSSHVSTYVHDLIGLNFNEFISSRVLLLLYKTLFFKQPNYLCQRFRFGNSERSITLVYPRCRSNIMINSFSMRAAELWNNLVPNHLRGLSLLPHLFKKKIYSFF